MGRAELALALKQKGEAEVKAIWLQAREEAERYRQQRQQEVARRGESSGREADQSAAQMCRQVDWQVTKTTRALRLQALQGLEQRLWQIIAEELSRLEPELRRQHLGSLVAEIPAADWQTVSTHPDDDKLVKKEFPGCRIRSDADLAGGLIVTTDDEAVRVDNSLLKRLENLWPVLAGSMLTELENEPGGPE